MYHYRRFWLTLCILASFTPCSARAEFVSDDGRARLSGFGTLGVSRTNTDDVLFNYTGQGGGVDKQPGAEPDTKFALQASYKFLDSLSGTAQVMTKYRANGQYQPEFEWAFIKWQARPDLALRLGRLSAPFFMISDFRDVGYAITTIRPPIDVYAQAAISSVDGGDVTYQTSVGNTAINASLWGGYSKPMLSTGLTSGGVPAAPVAAKTTGELGLTFSAEFDNGLTLRAGHMKANFAIDAPTLQGLVAQLEPFAAFAPGGIQAIRDAILTPSAPVSFSGIGYSYDSGDWVSSGEYTLRLVTKGAVPDSIAWYLLVGRRFGTFLPYLMKSEFRVKSSNLGAATAETVGPLAVDLKNVQDAAQQGAQKTTTFGIRWDAFKNAAFKVQFDRVKKPAASNGLFLVKDAADPSILKYRAENKRIDIISVAVDFVF